MDFNMVGWFEIPVRDMERAKSFYDTVFQVDIKLQGFGGTKMGWFPADHGKPGASGSLIQNKDWYKPSKSKGALIYFNSLDVQNELDRIEPNGGKIVQPKTQISPEIGYMAVFLDSEGNRIALHSRQ
ncbi:VOC family protein [Flagellimonas halotolerans]|uniref:VOC family protein n=1 Tax=Flagellimonas halotolerans TaxID=3112164 RepID=A0ABU6IUE5_9FLAO|nr:MULTISPECIES: VOC family protein [unclassified Allomuricauda]MEC3966923.1 VOC family protein [Muricauda sp. SYSU M86414]MEC4266758.1 VOC family protein [Muricauda sp. SYSU M84420]